MATVQLSTKNVLLAIDRHRQMQRVQEALCISGAHLRYIIERLLVRKLVIYDNRLDLAILTRKGYKKIGRDVLTEARQQDLFNLMVKQAKRELADKRRRNIEIIRRSTK